MEPAYKRYKPNDLAVGYFVRLYLTYDHNIAIREGCVTNTEKTKRTSAWNTENCLELRVTKKGHLEWKDPAEICVLDIRGCRRSGVPELKTVIPYRRCYRYNLISFVERL